MVYLHDKNIIHRDLKPANILVVDMQDPNAHVNCKIIDFGLATSENNLKTYCGTPGFIAPEIDINGDMLYNNKVDVFSFGMIIWQMLNRTRPFENIKDSSSKQKEIKIGKRPDIPKWCPLEISYLIKICWDEKPEERPSFINLKQELLTIYQKIHNIEPKILPITKEGMGKEIYSATQYEFTLGDVKISIFELVGNRYYVTLTIENNFIAGRLLKDVLKEKNFHLDLTTAEVIKAFKFGKETSKIMEKISIRIKDDNILKVTITINNFTLNDETNEIDGEVEVYYKSIFNEQVISFGMIVDRTNKTPKINESPVVDKDTFMEALQNLIQEIFLGKKDMDDLKEMIEETGISFEDAMSLITLQYPQLANLLGFITK